MSGITDLLKYSYSDLTEQQLEEGGPSISLGPSVWGDWLYLGLGGRKNKIERPQKRFFWAIVLDLKGLTKSAFKAG